MVEPLVSFATRDTRKSLVDQNEALLWFNSKLRVESRCNNAVTNGTVNNPRVPVCRLN